MSDYICPRCGAKLSKGKTADGKQAYLMCLTMNCTYAATIPEYHARGTIEPLRAEVARLEGELAEARDGIAELWNLCEILPHNEDCDLSGTSYCDCNRAIFNGTLQNIMDANHTGEGEG